MTDDGEKATGQTADEARMMVGGQHAADRMLASHKLKAGSPYLCGQPPPTPSQVSAVLHALADHALIEQLHEVALDLASDRADLGEPFQRASGMGRFFQRMGDWIAWGESDDPPG